MSGVTKWRVWPHSSIKPVWNDLGSFAAEGTIERDRSLGLGGLAAQDLLEFGNAHIGMENDTKAEQCFRDAPRFSCAERIC